jgi:hypothetical protein
VGTFVECPPFLFAEKLDMRYISEPMGVIAYVEILIDECRGVLLNALPALAVFSNSPTKINEYLASFIWCLTVYQLSFPNALIGNLLESALTARFPLNRFAGMI